MRRITASPSLLLPPALLMVLFLSVSFYGLNFGVHWDEVAAKFDSVRDTVKTGLFIQGSGGAYDGFNYNYGGVNYILTWAGFTPEIVKFLKGGTLSRASLADQISPLIYTMPIRLRVRAIYLVLCSLSILWLYLLNIVLGRSQLESFLAAAILAGSWEVEYHSRWIAPDGVMMQFALLSLLCLAVGYTSKKTFWFFLGAVSIGLAAGTKYPAGILLPFFLIGAAWSMWQETHSVIAVGKRTIALGGTCFLTFVVTTPGILIDPFHFFYQLNLQRTIYASGFFGYSVKPGINHSLALMRYFLLQVFSHYWLVSIPIAGFCLVGFYSIVRSSPKLLGLVMTGFALAYLGYFSQQSAMIVRNLLVVVPIFCLAAARGITFLAGRSNWKVRAGIYSWIGISLMINLGWEIYAARQIKLREHGEYFLMKFEDYVRNSPRETILVSSKLSTALHAVPSAPIPANIVTDPDKAYTKVAFFQNEGPVLDKYWPTWPANKWGLYETSFGALEVNLDAYPTFVGNERILLLTSAHFQRLPIKVKDILAP